MNIVYIEDAHITSLVIIVLSVLSMKGIKLCNTLKRKGVPKG